MRQKKRSFPIAAESPEWSQKSVKTSATNQSIPYLEDFAKRLDRLTVGESVDVNGREYIVDNIGDEFGGQIKHIHLKKCPGTGYCFAAAVIFLLALAALVAMAAADAQPPSAAAAGVSGSVPNPAAYLFSDTSSISVSPPPASPKPAPRYALTDHERDTVERVVMAESGGEPLEGQMLVAQCILNAAEKSGERPDAVVVAFKYTAARPKPTDSVRRAVSAVFDDGKTVVDEKILYFYAPALCSSEWHESQRFVIEEGGHRFFAGRETDER